MLACEINASVIGRNAIDGLLLFFDIISEKIGCE